MKKTKAKKAKTSNASSGAKTDADGNWFDSDEADRVCEFFSRFLVHVKGEWMGRPFILDEWQRERVIRPLFGWKRPDGTRKYRRCYIEIPRKNGKSSLAAGIALVLLCADGEPGAEVYSAAGDREQAAIVFEVARSMTEASAELKKRCSMFRRSIVYGGSSYKVLSADAYTKHGLNAHGIVVDELHTQPNRDLVDVLSTSTGSRRQPVEVYLTTAGFDRESICWEYHDYAEKVLAGIIVDPAFLPVIYKADDTDDFQDPRVWAKANPGLHVSVKLDYLAQQCRNALNIPAFQNTFKRLHLNLWTSAETAWLEFGQWDGCAAAVDEAQLEGRICYAGLDLATTTDIAAFVMLFAPVEPGEPYKAVCRFWIPSENIQRRLLRDRVPYDAWVRDGWITATEGNVIDYQVIKNQIVADAERFDIREVAFDRWGAVQISTELTDAGITMLQFGQGFASMSAPMKELQKYILSKALAHGGHPVLRWMAANVMAKTDAAGNIKPDREKSREKIDGIVALIMAVNGIIRHPDSVYESEGLKFL